MRTLFALALIVLCFSGCVRVENPRCPDGKCHPKKCEPCTDCCRDKCGACK